LAYDARSHEVVGKRSSFGPLEEVYTLLPDLPAARFSFVVPEGGGALRSFPPSPQQATDSHSSSLRAARHELGASPLWLGPRFRGQRLRSVEVGTEGMKARDGATLRRTRFVSLVYGVDYGSIKLQEFQVRQTPFWYAQGPLAGRVVLDGRAALTRDGVLVIAERDSLPMNRALALAVAKALRPLPRG
jgi:hypothetical protein